MKISEQFVDALESLRKVGNYEETGDDLYEVLEKDCKDDYTRGYLTHYLETKGDYFYGEELFEEFYCFVKRLKEVNNQ